MLKIINPSPTVRLQPLASWVESYSRRQNFRRMARSLLAERDDILLDLGYHRHELKGAMNLPLRSNALEYIEAQRAKRFY
jgi:hypothetical protein